MPLFDNRAYKGTRFHVVVAYKVTSITNVKALRIHIQTTQMPLLWGAQILRRLQAFNRKCICLHARDKATAVV